MLGCRKMACDSEPIFGSVAQLAVHPLHLAAQDVPPTTPEPGYHRTDVCHASLARISVG